MPAPLHVVPGTPGAEVEAAVAALLHHTAVDGRTALSEVAVEGMAAGAGLTLLLGGPAGNGPLLGLARLFPVAGSWQLELAVDRSAAPAGAAGGRLLSAARAEVARAGGGRVHYWIRLPGDQADAEATAAGFVFERRLLQLRVGLPLPPSGGASVPPPVTLRTFRPGRDEASWLEVNNRAFAGHPEQGGWDLATLRSREDEPWFDPAGFLLAEEGGRLVGFCWTKVHLGPGEPMGEIYVIAVDPSVHRGGLGRALTVGGLEWLAAAGLPTGMLYVDAANVAATSLYQSLGFTVHHAERAYVAEVAAAGTDRPHPGGAPAR